MDDDKTVLVALSVLDERVARMQDLLERFNGLLERFLPLLEKYEKMGKLFGGNNNKRETTWPNPK